MKLSTLLFLPVLTILIYVHAARAGESPQAPENDAQKVEIVVDSYSFTPDTIKVAAGKPVELTLRSVTSLIPHNFTIDDPASGLSLDIEIPSGEDVTVTFVPQNKGTFQFYCAKKNVLGSHIKKGMKGTIVVE